MVAPENINTHSSQAASETVALDRASLSALLTALACEDISNREPRNRGLSVSESLGGRLRLFRLQRGSSVEEVSQSLGLTVERMAEIESGVHLPDTLQLTRLCQLYEVRTHDLFSAHLVALSAIRGRITEALGSDQSRHRDTLRQLLIWREGMALETLMVMGDPCYRPQLAASDFLSPRQALVERVAAVALQAYAASSITGARLGELGSLLEVPELHARAFVGVQLAAHHLPPRRPELESLVVERVRGDLLEQDVDVIVNAWNRNLLPDWLLLTQGVSGAIKRYGGLAPFHELRREGILPLGAARLTGPGNLPFKGIIHVAGIDHLWRSSEYSIRLSVESALALARARGFTSIAFPAIGAGSTVRCFGKEFPIWGVGTSRSLKLIEAVVNKSNFKGRVVIVEYAPGERRS